MNYLIEQKITLARPRFSIRDEDDRDVYVVEGKALRIHEQLWIRDVEGNDVAFVREHGAVKTRFEISRGGAAIATMVPKRKMFKVNFLLTDATTGAEIAALGNFTGYEYEFQRDGATVATVKKTRRFKDRYALEVREGEDDVLFIAAVLAIDAYQAEMERRRDEQRRRQGTSY